MPEEQYTHTFKFEIDGSFIRGEAEFNTDGKASYKIEPEGLSQPLPDYVLRYFQEIMDIMVKIAHTTEEGLSIKKIVIKEK